MINGFDDGPDSLCAISQDAEDLSKPSDLLMRLKEASIWPSTVFDRKTG